MDNLNLSKRLMDIAGYVPKGSKVADIGSDHALLPAYLVKNQISMFVIAGEVNNGPYQTALSFVQSLNLSEFISVRKGNGLEVIEKNEVDVITIAGMGGALIATILEQGQTKLSNIQRLVLQPNVGEAILREWLQENDWKIIDEDILEENEKIYEIIVAEKAKASESTITASDLTMDELLKIGPALWQKKSPILIKKWQREEKKIDLILKQLENSRSEQDEKKDALLKEKQWIEKVIQCMQKDKQSSN